MILNLKRVIQRKITAWLSITDSAWSKVDYSPTNTRIRKLTDKLDSKAAVISLSFGYYIIQTFKNKENCTTNTIMKKCKSPKTPKWPASKWTYMVCAAST
jgi:hypothetical protein